MNLSIQLINKLAFLHHIQFTGILTTTTKKGQFWKIYLYLGQLLWTESTIHRNRFWQRNLTKLCPKLTSTYHEFNTINNNYISDYYLINVLRDNKLVCREKILELIKRNILDIFFEILQYEATDRATFFVKTYPPLFFLKSGFNLSLSSLPIFPLLEQAETNWINWKNKGLASCSPNLAPLLKQAQELEKQLSPIIFQNMLRLLDGKNTLRDLAIKMDKDVLEIALGLVPYFFKGYVRLLEVPDLPKIHFQVA